MDIYYKKVDSRRYVPSNCHPKKCKKTYLLICTIVGKWEVRKNIWTNFKNFYIPKNLIQEKIRKTTSILIENLRASKAKSDSNNFAVVLQISNQITKTFFF